MALGRIEHDGVVGRELEAGASNLEVGDGLGLSRGFSARLNAVVGSNVISNDLLALVDLCGNSVPESFYEVFLLARTLDRLTGDRELIEVLEGEERTNEPEVVESTVGFVESGYTLEPCWREAEGLHDLELVNPEDLAMTDFRELMLGAIDGSLMVSDLRLAGEASTSSSLSLHSADSDRFNESEQDLYILIDLSLSMDYKYRLRLAQVLVLWYLSSKYLKQKKRPRLHLRGFANDLGDLVRATHMDDLPAVINEVLAADARQKGTDAQQAFLGALSDIRHFSLNGAAVLMVTDGLGIVDGEEIAAAVPGDVDVNVVRIGKDVIEPTKSAYHAIAKEKGWDPAIDVNFGMATAVFNDRIQAEWNMFSRVIDVDDVGSFEVDPGFVGDVRAFLDDHVFPLSFSDASVVIIRRASFIYDLLGNILAGREGAKPIEDEAALLDLHEELGAWLSHGIKVEIAPEFAGQDLPPAKGSLRLGSHMASMALRLRAKSKGLGVLVNFKDLVIKIIWAAFRRVFRRS